MEATAGAGVVMDKRAIAERLILILALAAVDLLGRVENVLLRIGLRKDRGSPQGARSRCR
jgi:hypothetical protein